MASSRAGTWSLGLGAGLGLSLALWSASISTLVGEEELHLGSGTVLVGEIITETPTAVIIRTQALIRHKPMAAQLTIPKDQIDSRSTVPSFSDQYAVRDKHSPETVEARLALARWCMDCCLVPEAILNLQRADALDSFNPLVAQLFKELGYLKSQGHWVPGDDTLAASGRAVRPPVASTTAASATPAPSAPASSATPAPAALAVANAIPAGADTIVILTAQDVPPAVMAVMAKAAAGSTLIEFVKDLEEGAVVYSAEFTGADGKLMEVTVSKDAVLLDVSPEVDEAPVAAAATPGASAATPAADTPDISVTARDLPAPAMAAMTKAAGRFPLVDFVRAVDSGKTVFSAEFTDATGTIMEVTVTKEGELLDVSPEVEEPVTPLRGR